jgi:GNAT superfamily N-acetyltransferase
LKINIDLKREVEDMGMEIVELDHSLVHYASLLLASYRFEGGWNGQELEECTSSLLRLLEYNNAFCLLARQEDEYLGFVTFHWGFSTTKGLPILKIQDVFTLPKHRKKGVAQTLLKYTLELASKNGAHRLQLETDTDNVPARALYTKIGFEWISQKEVYMLPLNRWEKPTFGEQSGDLEYHRRKEIIKIMAVDLDKANIADLVIESLNEGHRHIQRLHEEYESGKNRFSGSGEALFAAFLNDRIIGICGLNKDPYLAETGMGRVRRLYVLNAYRRHGVGRKLVNAVIQEAKKYYTVIVLRTDNPVADKFYRSLGFSDQPKYAHSTHHLQLDAARDSC